MTTGADQKPGRYAYEHLTDIEKTLAGHLTDLSKILNSDNIKEFNAMLQTCGKDKVIVEKD